MRLFFAIRINDAATQAIVELQENLRRKASDPGIRWVAREQLHYTMKFLGEVSEALLPACCEAARASAVAPFQLELAGVGAFPNPRSPRVLWVGAAVGAPMMERIAARLDSLLTPLGFEAEKRAFTPHLTIARIKDPSAAKAASRVLQSALPGSLATAPIDRMVLMQSHLSPRGATYAVVETFPFPT